VASRAWVASQVASRLATPLAAVQMGGSDLPGELGEPIDDALRMLGYEESELATAEPDDPLGFLYLAIYTTLTAIWHRMVSTFDISSQGDSLKLSQRIGNVERMLAAAKADVIRVFGDVPAGAGDGGGGILTLDMGYLSDGASVVSRDFPYTVIGAGDG